MAAGYEEFYQLVYLPEHRHPANRALHIVGTLAGLALIVGAVAALWLAPLWALAALAFPIVHVGPGLVGHRLFDRDPDVGDLRVTRRDFPLFWFVRANHRLTWRTLTGR